MEEARKKILYVTGLLEDLKKSGKVKGGFSLSEKGRKNYVKLVNEGFDLPDEELKEIVAFLYEESGKNKVAFISFGPDYGPLEQRQAEEAIKEARKLKKKPDFVINRIAPIPSCLHEKPNHSV